MIRMLGTRNLFARSRNLTIFMRSKDIIKRDYNNVSGVRGPVIFRGGGYETLVTDSSIFVDKSLLIEEIFELRDAVTLITMPRRWGKSLNLEMLQKFLEIQVNENGTIIDDNERRESLNYKLFAGGTVNIKGLTDKNITIKPSKLIEKIPTAINIQGHYPVIFLDLKNCKGCSFAQVRSKLHQVMIDTMKKFVHLAGDKNIFRGQITIGLRYSEILDIAKSDDFELTIMHLCELLYVRYRQKVWVLVDEYDAAVNLAYLEFDTESANSVVFLFRNVFESIFKGNNYLNRGVLTGVQYLLESGLLSGINNLAKFNIKSTIYSRYYGIDQEEMDLLLNHFSIEEPRRSKIKDWYNGYQENIGSDENKIFIDKYNIWSVVNYLNKQNEGFQSYWGKSGTTDFLRPLFKRQSFKEIIESLVNGGSVTINNLKDDFTVHDFHLLKELTSLGSNSEIDFPGVQLIFSYFYILGYLTNVKGSSTEYQLPNKEIIKVFGECIQEYYYTIFHIDNNKLSQLTNILNKVFDTKSVQDIRSIFNNEFSPALNKLIQNVALYTHAGETKDSRGLFANENLMHSLLNFIVLQIVNSKFASERYTTKPDGRKGIVDLVIEKNGTGLIIEMKYDGSAVDALKQSKQYERLLGNCSKKIFIGCNITSTQKVLISGTIVNNDGTVVNFEYL